MKSINFCVSKPLKVRNRFLEILRGNKSSLTLKPSEVWRSGETTTKSVLTTSSNFDDSDMRDMGPLFP